MTNYSHIYQAAARGDIQAVLVGIEEGAHDLHGIALFAARAGHRSVVMEMINKGCRDTWPMAINALWFGHVSLAMELFLLHPVEFLAIVIIMVVTLLSLLQ